MTSYRSVNPITETVAYPGPARETIAPITETVAYPGPARETVVAPSAVKPMQPVSAARSFVHGLFGGAVVSPTYQHAPHHPFVRTTSTEDIYGNRGFSGQVPYSPPPFGQAMPIQQLPPSVRETRAPIPIGMPLPVAHESTACPMPFNVPRSIHTLPPSAFETSAVRYPRGRSGSLGTFPVSPEGNPKTRRSEEYRQLDRIHEDGHPDTARFETEEFREFHAYLTKSTATGRSSLEVAEVGQVENSEDAIEVVMAKLRDPTCSTTLDRLYNLLALCKLSNWRDQKCVDLITQHKFAELFIDYWNLLDRSDKNLNDQINDPQSYLIANLLMDATQRFTELSPKLCGQLRKNHGVSSLLRFVKGDFFDVEALNLDDDELQWMSRRELLKKIFTILYNCIRNNPDSRKVFRKHRAYEMLKPFLDCRFFILRAKALFILAYIVTEEENEKLNTTSLNIEFIVKILRRSLEDENDHYSAHYNFFAVEVAEAVAKVAANDENKVQFVEAGVLSHLVTMMGEKYSLEERKGALMAVWMLSFAQENKDRILQQKDLIDEVKSCQDVGELSQTSRSILWNMGLLTADELTTEQGESNQEDTQGDVAAHGGDAEGAVRVKMAPKSVARQSDGGKRPHVMISYQWDVQKQIIAVKNELKKNGFNVWLDLERMGGSTLEAMAAAVEESAVVIICFSEKYKDSPACRTEAEYTYKLRKPIVPLKMQKGYDANGWLGAMLGTKLWIEMHTLDHVTQNFAILFRELAERGRYADAIQDEPVDDMPLPDPVTDSEDDDDDDDDSSSTSSSTTYLSWQPSAAPQVTYPDASPYRRSPVIVERIVEVPVIQERVVTVPSTAELPANRSQTFIQVALQWDADDVRTWLRSNNFEHVQNWFVGFNGRDIVGLKQVAAEAPSYFYNKLETEYGFRSLLEIIRFKQILDDIK